MRPSVFRAGGRRRPRRMAAYLGAATLAAAAMVGHTEGNPERAFAQAPAPAKGSVGWDTFRDLDGLSKLRSGEQSKQFSSYARDGSNDDGFHGTYSCLGGPEQRPCVLAEHAGPGEITSMWFTREPYGDVTATGNIKVELDGRVVLDAPLQELVEGRKGAPFVWPLVGDARDTAGAAVIKVPMPYRQSMRVTTDSNPNFYHVDYRTFPNADGVQTFNPADPAEDVLARLRRFGVADPKPANPQAQRETQDFQLAPGASQTVAELNGPAQINEFKLKVPQVLPSPRVVDDGHAYGEGGGSNFNLALDPNNQGARLVRRFDPQIGHQVADVSVDGVPVGQWRSGPAAPGAWDVQVIDLPASVTAGKSNITVNNRFVSSEKDVNEFRYDVQSNVNNQWIRTDVLDLGPAHPGEEQAHSYEIANPVFAREKLIARYAFTPEQVQASDDILKNVRVRITFDGKTTVDAPIGELFGSGLGEYDVRTLMSSMDPGNDGWYTAWWPMPFKQNARVEVVNTGSIPIDSGTADVTHAPNEMDPNAGYFNANHKSGQTVNGQDWNFLRAQGAGTFYGVTHSMQGLIPPGGSGTGVRSQPLSRSGPLANQRNYLEGDERFFTDGKPEPDWHGTGTEDYYEGGWYFRDGTTFSMPLAGNPSHEISGDGCRYDCTGAYRLQIPDAVGFANGFDGGIEHGPANNEPGIYSSTAYWYGNGR